MPICSSCDDKYEVERFPVWIAFFLSLIVLGMVALFYLRYKIARQESQICHRVLDKMNVCKSNE